MRDTKERLSLYWSFALLNYLYADVLALFAFIGSPNTAPHLPQSALLGSAVLMEIPIAMIVASRLLPFGANRLANILAAGALTLINGCLTFVLPVTRRRLSRSHLSSVRVVRDDRNRLHPGHPLEGVRLEI